MCRRTVLGPAYGQPVDHMLVLPAAQGSSARFVAFASGDKVCGAVVNPPAVRFHNLGLCVTVYPPI